MLRLQRLHGHSRGRRGWLLQESSLNNHGEPLFFFLFEKFLLLNSSRHSKQVPGLSHSPTLQPDQGPSGSGPIMAQLFPAGVHSLSGCTVPMYVCQYILIPPAPHSDFKYPGPSWHCSNLLVWQGRKLLTWLSPKNPTTAPAGTGPGAGAALVPMLVPGTLFS